MAERLPIDFGDELDCGCRIVQLSCCKSFEHQTGAEFEEGKCYYVCQQHFDADGGDGPVVYIEGYYTEFNEYFDSFSM